MANPPVIARPAQTTLGCGTVNVVVQPRGGGRRVVFPRSAAASTRNWSTIEWHRLENDASGAQLRVEGRAQCCDWASRVRAWEHELAVYYDTGRVWSGPVTEVNWTGDELRIDCKDLGQWFRRRKLHNDHDFVTGTDLASIMAALVDDGMSVDRSPKLTVSTTACGTLVTAAEGRSYKAAQTRYINDLVNELAGVDLVWTVLDRTLYIRGPQSPSRTDSILRSEHFEDTTDGTLDGDLFGTRFVVSGAGTGPAGDTITQTNAIDTALEDTYGVHEVLVSAPQVRAAFEALAIAESRFSLLGRRGVPFYLTGGTLRSNAPIGVNDLVPGRIFRVEDEDLCRPTPQHVRLTGVHGSVGPDHQSMNVDLSPIVSGDD